MNTLLFDHHSSHRTILWIFLFLYSMLVIFGIYNHEPWRDEAHAWVAAREDTLGQMIHDIHFAPRPLLWFFLLSPLAKSDFPYISMSLLHAGIAIMAVAFFLFFSKIPIFIKVLFIFSYYMAYEYAVIARNYALTIPPLFCIAMLYSDRHRKPLLYALLIAVLFQTDNYSFVPAGTLSLLYSLEIFLKKTYSPKAVFALGIMASSAILTIVMLTPDPCCISQDPPQNPAVTLPTVFRNAFVPSFPVFTFGILRLPLLDSVITLTSILVIISLLVMIWEEKTIFLFGIATFSWLLFTNLFIHAGTLRHHGLFLIYLVAIWWMVEANKHVHKWYQLIVKGTYLTGLSFLLVCSLFFTLYIYYQDYTYNFSGAADMAAYIRTNKLERITTVLSTPLDGVAILPYFPTKRFWYPEFETYGRYHLYDRRIISVPVLREPEIIALVNKNLGNTAPVLLLLSWQLATSQNGYTLLHTATTKYFWGNATEQFWLYERKGM